VSRLSLSDVLASQEALVERLIVELNEERAESRELRKLLTEWISRPQRTATETVELTRAAMGDHATGIKITAASQNGETLEDVEARVSAAFERRAMRYTLPDGSTHAAPLGPDDLEAKLRASVEGLRAVPEPEETSA
jgi:hypothetical protein